MDNAVAAVTGIILAAGRSSRMGRFKPLLPWGQRTVIEQVTATLLAASLAQVLVVSGHEHEALAAALRPYPVRVVYNPDFAQGEMISSIQVGLRAVQPESEGALLAVGDQPRIQIETATAVLDAWRRTPQRIVIPSYQMRRGHPICLPRRVWPAILALSWQESLRSLWQRLAAQIEYVAVASPTILSDMDTPADYQREVSANAHDGYDLSQTQQPA